AGELHERLHRWLPGIEEVPGPVSPPAQAELDGGVRLSRDREEEVRDYARRVKVTARSAAPVPLERMALVVRRPLPYVYLAREILRSAGVPCQLHDALPLAAEPFAAALDLVSTSVASGWSRQTLTALLSSPVFRFGDTTDGRTLAAFDRALHEAGFLGGAAALESLVPQWEAEPRRARLAGAGRLAVSVIEELAPLASEQPAAAHLRLVRSFLERHAREQVDEELASRYARARAAVLNGLAALEAAFVRYDTRPMAFAEVDAVVRHWVERHTFAPRTGEAGLHVVDAESALTGDFDDVQIAGLVEGEWPQRPAAGVFYSAGLLRQLGWPSDADRVAGERTLLADLLTLARTRTVVSGFRLEDDALVSVSPFVELLPGAEMRTAPGAELAPPAALPQVCLDEALMGADPQVPDGSLVRQAWVDLRLLRAGRVLPAPEVTLRPYSVSALDRYQDCPFKFFAAEVLRIEEPPEDQSALTPRAQGTLLHDVLRRFFEEWDRTGRVLSPSAVAEARRHLAAVVDAALDHLPPADVALERARFFGSPVAPGIVDVLLRLEASRTEPVERRWLEQPLEGAFSLGGVGRQVLLRGKVDRVDMLAGRRLRVIDYKSGAVTQAKRSLQAPVYALLTAERLAEEDGEPWSIEEASYVAFAGKRTVAPAIKPGSADRAAALADARERTFEILDGVAAGAFPVRPHDLMTCRYCSYASVCRKDYVGDE
ncbi:MAG: PD-(D/E)XK nuclease family protein, partial [Vicinamibacterales bacterium]|nr:PD-(D/E)XK nuclease family protein [Vicinamibacterales bacterium]